MKARDAALKAKIAFEAAKEEKTISQLASEYGFILTSQDYNIQWKKKLLEELPTIFSDKRVYSKKDREELEAELCRQPDIAIIQLKVELEGLKKSPRHYS